tara:strand:+ start:27651 stop:27872 length:222 start_codon:yes stop_codon:yes gene_type:complete
MSVKSSIVFSLEVQHSTIFWGCKDSSEGEDLYKDTILPFNVGDEVTKDDKVWVVDSKDWDFDHNMLYFVIKLK